MSTHFIGGTVSSVQKILLTEHSPLTLPPNTTVLHSEVVVNSEGDEVLELWLSVPSVGGVVSDSTAADGPKTIYTNTVIHDDEPDNFKSDIEDAVNSSLEEYGVYEDDNDWH